MKRYSWIVFVLLGFMSLRLFAQEATEEAPQGWPIVERCVGEPMAPPAEWSFEGTILATGWAQIHGINAQWETPRVLAFRVLPRRSYWSAFNSAISLDGHWYSELHWQRLYTNSVYGGWRIKELVVSSLINRGEVYRIQFPDTERYDWDGLLGGYAGAVVPFWWDESHVLVINDLVNPFTGEISQAPRTEYPNEDTISPDRTREVQRYYHYLNDPYHFIRYENGERDYRLVWEDWVFDVEWKSDSSFLAVNFRDGGIHLLDRDGEFIDKITDGAELGNFSYDNRYLSLGIDFQLHVADIQEQIIYNTCLPYSQYHTGIFRGKSWNPLHNQRALMAAGEGQRPVLIFDFDSWQLYETGFYHDGAIVGWRAD